MLVFLPLHLGCIAPAESAAAESGASDTGACAGAPVVTWANFGQGFVLEQCEGCHAATTADRYGAPADMTFDTVDEVWAHADDVLRMATGDTPAMPPAGGTTADDRSLLTWWLTCATEGT